MPKKTARAQIAQDGANGVDGNGDEQDRQAKRAKQSVGTKIADEFVCPISHNLPIDPVTAEDVSRVFMRVYLFAIEQRIDFFSLTCVLIYRI